jgi:hypothetical protein
LHGGHALAVRILFGGGQPAANVSTPVLPAQPVAMILHATSGDAAIKVQQIGSIVAAMLAPGVASVDFSIGDYLVGRNQPTRFEYAAELFDVIGHAQPRMPIATAVITPI